MRMLALNGLMVRVVEAFEAVDLPVLAIKGPVNRAWLYDDPAGRTYSDVDLLIDPRSRGRAREVLAGMGLVDHHAQVLGVYRPLHEEAWRDGAGVVDLHWSVAGIAPRRWEQAWAALRDDAEEFALGGRMILTPDAKGRSLLLGLHAAQSTSGDTSRADLRLALDKLPAGAWSQALAMADDLRCDGAFVSGLSMETAGCRTLERLGRAPRQSFVSYLSTRETPYRTTLWAARLVAAWQRPVVTPPGLLAVSDTDLPVARRLRTRIVGGGQAARGLVEFVAAALRWALIRRGRRTTSVVPET